MTEHGTTNFTEIVKLANNVVENLTNVAGHVEKNINSYDSIASRFKRKRLAARLEEILVRLVSLRSGNAVTLFYLARWSSNDKCDEEFDRYSSLEIEDWQCTFEHEF